MQHGFYFDHQRCVKCHACEIACKTWNEVEIGPRWREVVKIETGTFPENGIVTVDPNKCIGCGFCAWACPFNAPQLSAEAGKMEKCNFCQTPGKERPLDMPRACEEICPTGAIRSGPMTLLATLGREASAARLGSASVQGLPGLILDAQRQFGMTGS